MASYVLSREGSVPYEDIPSKEEQKDSKVREGLKLGALLIVGLLALGVMLIYLDFVLVPLVFSRFLLYCFQPFVNVLIGKKPCPFCHVRLRWPRWLAVTTVLLLLVVIFVLFGLIVAVTISDIIEKSDFYVEQLNQLMERIVVLGEQWGYTREQVLGLIPEINFAKYGMLVLQYLVNVIPQMVLVLLIMIYMLVGYDGSNKSKLRSKIDFQIRTYILIHSLISVGTGIGAWLVLVIFKVDLALFLGFDEFYIKLHPQCRVGAWRDFAASFRCT
jgi:predicted PurR-regulated permease PerM